MTLTRLREIVAALRADAGWFDITDAETRDAVLLLATLAGIGSEDVDLDGFVARALAATPGPWRAIRVARGVI